MRGVILALITGVAVTSIVSSARTQPNIESYEIMRPEQPEPWLAPKYKSPRRVKRQRLPKIGAEPSTPAAVPGPIVVPRTGRALQNLPPSIGAGAGGAETSQDRALRCAHQAGVYGSATGGGSYLGSCINQ